MFTMTIVAQGSRARTAALLCVALLLFTLTGRALAQTTTGQISGSVVDSSGQVIVGATVTLRNEGDGVTPRIVTQRHRRFSLPDAGPRHLHRQGGA